MKTNELQPPAGAKKPRKRIGRGHGTGQGKQAGRGAKGQAKRSGGTKGPYFEGGQLPLVRRLPTLRGFHNRNRIDYQPVNVGELAASFAPGSEITPDLLAQVGIVRANRPVVVLGDGGIDVAMTVKAHRFSASAEEKIRAAGGAVEVLPLLTL